MIVVKLIKSARGEGYILPCTLILIVVALFTIILTYSTVVTQVNVMRENSKVVLDSFVTANATQIYNSIKQGNNQTDSLDSAEYKSAMISFCTLDESDTMLYHYDSDGTLVYSITQPTLRLRVDNELEVIAEYTMTLPVRFNGVVVTHATVPITIVSSFSEKF